LSDRTRCFLVVSGDRFVHATWMTTAAAWTREVRAYFRPPPKEAYIYESFTRADARGRGIYSFALAGIASRLAEIAIERVWVAVEAHNAPSLRAVGKAGFEEAARVRYERRFGRLRVDGPCCPAGEPTSLCLASTPDGVAR
jgi:RimJ/RimL family protein N-acetyltransferase